MTPPRSRTTRPLSASLGRGYTGGAGNPNTRQEEPEAHGETEAERAAASRGTGRFAQRTGWRPKQRRRGKTGWITNGQRRGDQRERTSRAWQRGPKNAV